MEFMGHSGRVFIRDEANDADWYECACGGSYGRREWPPRKGRGEREPTSVGPTFAEHVMQAEGLVRARDV